MVSWISRMMSRYEKQTLEAIWEISCRESWVDE